MLFQASVDFQSAPSAVQIVLTRSVMNLAVPRTEDEDAKSARHTGAELLTWLRRILIHNLASVVEEHLKAQKRDARREVTMRRYLDYFEQSSAGFDAALVSHWTTPSSLRAERAETDRRYRCFSCQRSGNQLELWAALQGKPFHEAVRDS